jgi:hypothetical protein
MKGLLRHDKIGWECAGSPNLMYLGAAGVLEYQSLGSVWKESGVMEEPWASWNMSPVRCLCAEVADSAGIM